MTKPVYLACAKDSTLVRALRTQAAAVDDNWSSPHDTAQTPGGGINIRFQYRSISAQVSMITDKLEALRAINSERLLQFPDSPFFRFAQREIDRINEHWQIFHRFNRPFYESLNIGLMCARELETVDPEYCSIVYELLEDLRLSTLG